jgi:hypothetical protein
MRYITVVPGELARQRAHAINARVETHYHKQLAPGFRPYEIAAAACFIVACAGMSVSSMSN